MRKRPPKKEVIVIHHENAEATRYRPSFNVLQHTYSFAAALQCAPGDRDTARYDYFPVAGSACSVAVGEQETEKENNGSKQPVC